MSRTATLDELIIALKQATKAAVERLLEIDEDFYYLVLVTSGDAALEDDAEWAVDERGELVVIDEA